MENILCEVKIVSCKRAAHIIIFVAPCFHKFFKFRYDHIIAAMKKQFLMMDVILYLYKKAKALVTMGMPMSILKESNIFDRIVSIKYDVPNDKPEMFDDYYKAIDAFYDEVIAKNA